MISIIIPTYNRAHLIPKTINSIVNQNYENWELIIVDDGSKDNTAEQVRKYLRDDRIKYIPKHNSGAAHSRNVGADYASGDYLVFLDSDDTAKPNWLALISEVISKNGSEVICCGCEKIDENGKIIDVLLPSSSLDLFSEIGGLFIGGTFFLQKKIFHAIGGYDNDLKSGQHTEMVMRLIPYLKKNNKKVFNVNESLVKINLHDEGDRIRENPELKIAGTLYCLRKHESFFNQHKDLKADYEGTVGRNAFLLNKKKMSTQFFLKSFISKPSVKRLGRLLLYIFKNYLA